MSGAILSVNLSFLQNWKTGFKNMQLFAASLSERRYWILDDYGKVVIKGELF